MPMDPTKFTDTAQLYVKYILSSIVLVRTFTVHLYLAFYIVMLWPAIFEEKAGLLIPWLVVGAVKCLAMGAMSFSTGLYICLTYRFSKAACWDFLLTQVIDQGPSIYMWFCVLSYYYDIKKKVPEFSYRCNRQTPSIVFSLAERRRRVRSLFADSKLQNTVDDDRQLISVSTIDNIINQLSINLRRDTSRSLDSMLSRLAAEAEKEEILDIKDDIVDEDKDFNYAERALKVLNISPSYVSEAKARKANTKLLTAPKGQNLKVQSSPVLQTNRSDPRKSKKLSVKIAPMESDELSLILSETEVGAIGFNEPQVKILEELHRDEIFRSTDTNFDIQKIFEKQNDVLGLEVSTSVDRMNNSNKAVEVKDSKINDLDIKDVEIEDLMVENLERKEPNSEDLQVKDLEVKELHINSLTDNISETSKVEYIASENDGYLHAQDIKNMTYRKSSIHGNARASSATFTTPSVEKHNTTLKQSPAIVKEPSVVLGKSDMLKKSAGMKPAVALGKSGIILREPSTVVKKQSISLGKSDVTLKKSPIVVKRPSAALEKLAVELKETSVMVRESSMTLETSAVPLEKLPITLQISSVSLKESSIILQESPLTVKVPSFALKDSLATLQKPSVRLKESLTILQESPATVKVPSFALKESLTTLQKPSVTPQEPSIALKGASFALTKSPVTLKEPSVTLNDTSGMLQVPSTIPRQPPVTLKEASTFSRAPFIKQADSYKKVENKPKVSQQISTPIETNVSKSLPKTIKFKSTPNAHFYSLSPPTFKHDGYTLAYIESQQRKAAADIFRSKKRPSSSGV
ncbi:hypothetical protein Trydic_g3514 [Trypoxylus dichotomus]